MKRYLILIGAPGSGKGTQGALLCDYYHLAHLSTGEVLRKEVAQQSSLGKKVEGFVSTGKLVPDEVIIAVMKQRLGVLSKTKAKTKGVLWDGFPRTLSQAQALDELLSGQVVACVLEVEKEELMHRLLSRGRADDKEETISQRLEIYRKDTLVLRDYYSKKGDLYTIAGMGSVEDIFERFRLVLDRVWSAQKNG